MSELPTPEPALRVLHITEALGGGISTAIESYVLRTPEVHHTVAAYRRPGWGTGDRLGELAGFIDLPEGKKAQWSAIRHLLAQHPADIVHVHSSWAGAFSRVSRRYGLPLAYTPHCFASERRDISTVMRLGYRVVERLLALRTDAFIPNGPHEADMCRRLPGHPLVAPVLCTPVDMTGRPLLARPLPDRPVVGTVGRAAPQKDPAFFVEVVKAHRRLDPTAEVQWRWIGGGDEADVAILVSAGVEVTGWCPREDALAALGALDLYVHPAAWEGFPLSIQEAAALAVPIVARRIDSLDPWPLPLGDTPEDVARLVQASLGAAPEERLATVARFRDALQREDASSDLAKVYRTLADARAAGG